MNMTHSMASYIPPGKKKKSFQLKYEKSALESIECRSIKNAEYSTLSTLDKTIF